VLAYDIIPMSSASRSRQVSGSGNEGAYLLLVIGAILLLPILAVIRSVLYSRTIEHGRTKQDTLTAPAVPGSTSGSVCRPIPTNDTSSDLTTTTTSSQGTLLSNNNYESTTTNNWRCVCGQGFLPAGMFGNAEAVLRMGSGQCYHNKRD
jgi:hypothetical protein